MYVPELIKREHLPCGFLHIKMKSDYCERKAHEFHWGNVRLLGGQSWKFLVVKWSILSSIVESIGLKTREEYCRCVTAHIPHLGAI